MQMDNWYDLTIRELSELTDPVREKLAEAALALPEPALEIEDEDEETPEPPQPRAQVDEDPRGA